VVERHRRRSILWDVEVISYIVVGALIVAAVIAAVCAGVL
jgi:hypothetical protein